MDSVNGYHATSPLKPIVLLSWRFKDALCKSHRVLLHVQLRGRINHNGYDKNSI